MRNIGLTDAVADRAAIAQFFATQAADNSAWRQRFHEAFCQALHHELTARQLDALRLRYVEGLSGREIARRWEITPSAVCRHLARAERKLRHLLGYNLEWRYVEQNAS